MENRAIGRRIPSRQFARIDADPERGGLVHAGRICARWIEQGIRSATEWQPLLEKPWDEVRQVLLDESEEGPFVRPARSRVEMSG